MSQHKNRFMSLYRNCTTQSRQSRRCHRLSLDLCSHDAQLEFTTHADPAIRRGMSPLLRPFGGCCTDRSGGEPGPKRPGAGVDLSKNRAPMPPTAPLARNSKARRLGQKRWHQPTSKGKPSTITGETQFSENMATASAGLADVAAPFCSQR